MDPGTILTLAIEKPAAGGRMLARHAGRVVLVTGAIPGERVTVRIERVAKGVVYAATEEVLVASPDRREPASDPRCGGQLLAHVAYARQLALKGEIVRDAFTRIARLPLANPPAVAGSPEAGYRIRARLHAVGDRIGFYREGTHQLCDAVATGQLGTAAGGWIESAQHALRRRRRSGLMAVEMAETVAGDARACHLELQAGADARAFGDLAEGLVGLSAARADRPGVVRLAGTTMLADTLQSRPGDPSGAVRLQREVRSFFQGNRFLLEPMLRCVIGLVPPGPVIDLYAGVGLFGLALATRSAASVTLVEGDPVSGADLASNAAACGGPVRVVRQSVEAFLQSARPAGEATCIVDPPRTGVSPEARAGLLRLRPRRLVYVSCDVATLARDSRVLVDAGYEMQHLEAFDLFPGTAHVEVLAVLERSAS